MGVRLEIDPFQHRGIVASRSESHFGSTVFPAIARGMPASKSMPSLSHHIEINFHDCPPLANFINTWRFLVGLIGNLDPVPGSTSCLLTYEFRVDSSLPSNSFFKELNAVYGLIDFFPRLCHSISIQAPQGMMERSYWFAFANFMQRKKNLTTERLGAAGVLIEFLSITKPRLPPVLLTYRKDSRKQSLVQQMLELTCGPFIKIKRFLRSTPAELRMAVETYDVMAEPFLLLLAEYAASGFVDPCDERLPQIQSAFRMLQFAHNEANRMRKLLKEVEALDQTMPTVKPKLVIYAVILDELKYWLNILETMIKLYIRSFLGEAVDLSGFLYTLKMICVEELKSLFELLAPLPGEEILYAAAVTRSEIFVV